MEWLGVTLRMRHFWCCGCMPRSLAFEQALCFSAEQEYLLLKQANILLECAFKVRIYVEFGFWIDEWQHFAGCSPCIE